jgi:hypothetical protein
MMKRTNMAMITGKTGTFRRITLAAALVVSTVWAGKTPPDAGGYTGTDAAAYSFIDLSVSGGSASVLTNQDDAVTLLTLPFQFTFYGTAYNLLCVSANGAAYFVTGTAACAAISDFQNVDLTAAATPGNLPALLPYWTDLVFQNGGAVYYQTQGPVGSRKFVVQWNNAYPQATVLSANPVTFEMVLYETSNRILFQYQTVNLGSANPANLGAQSTVGISDAGGNTSGRETQWSYDAAVLSDGAALLFAPAAGATTATQLFVSAPVAVATAIPFNVSVAALDGNNNLVPTYTGTVHFTGSDGQGVLPADSKLTNGIGTFSVTLKSLGNQTVTATDTVTSTITGTSGTIAVNLASALKIVKSHSGNFTQGQQGATYTVTVSNGAGGAPSFGTVTVTETVPTGSMTLATMTGTNWACTGNTCSRNDVLNPGASYEAIIVTVNVAPNAATAANQVSVSGGGSAAATASDTTTISSGSLCGGTQNVSTTVAGVQKVINEALGAVLAADDQNQDGVVNVVDVQIVINAVLNPGCSAAQ